MKTQKLILSLLLGFMSFTGATAQTEIERRFTEKVDSLNELFYLKSKEDRFKDCETISRNIIELYEEYSDKVSEGYSYFKYASYYNLACIQAKQGKKEEATASLIEALKNGKLEISYKKLINDSDLKNILDAEALKPVLDKLKATTDYLYILKNAPAHTKSLSTDTLPVITYLQADNPDLKRVRQYFNLDSLVVPNDETATIKNVLTYIHNKIRHDGQNGNPSGGANAIN